MEKLNAPEVPKNSLSAVKRERGETTAQVLPPEYWGAIRRTVDQGKEAETYKRLMRRLNDEADLAGKGAFAGLAIAAFGLMSRVAIGIVGLMYNNQLGAQLTKSIQLTKDVTVIGLAIAGVAGIGFGVLVEKINKKDPLGLYHRD